MVITNSKVPQYLSLVVNAYAIALWPFIFIRDEGNEVTINHEKIHLRQQAELLVIGFYILYGFYWLKSFVKYRDKVRAYYDIPFEQYGVVIFHPVTTDIIDTRKCANAISNAVLESNKNHVVILDT